MDDYDNSPGFICTLKKQNFRNVQEPLYQIESNQLKFTFRSAANSCNLVILPQFMTFLRSWALSSKIMHEDECKDVRIMGQAELKFQGYSRENPSLAYKV